ncbi:MAG: hypothetical protein AB2693_28000, partial [Candidatus Thiodiazotropha sp.]
KKGLASRIYQSVEITENPDGHSEFSGYFHGSSAGPEHRNSKIATFGVLFVYPCVLKKLVNPNWKLL